MLEWILAAAPFAAIGCCVVILVVRSVANKKKGQKRAGDYGTEGMCLGMCFGLLVGTMFGNAGVGLCPGLLLGLVIGMCIPRKPEDKDQ